jgi:hypothetical protein
LTGQVGQLVSQCSQASFNDRVAQGFSSGFQGRYSLFNILPGGHGLRPFEGIKCKKLAVQKISRITYHIVAQNGQKKQG